MEQKERLEGTYALVYPTQNRIIVSHDEAVRDAFNAINPELILNNNAIDYLRLSYVRAINNLVDKGKCTSKVSLFEYDQSESKINMYVDNCLVGKIHLNAKIDHRANKPIFRIHPEAFMRNTEYSISGAFGSSNLLELIEKINNYISENKGEGLRDAVIEELITMTRHRKSLYSIDGCIMHQGGFFFESEVNHEVFKIYGVYKNGFITFRSNGIDYKVKVDVEDKEALVKSIKEELLPILEQTVYYSILFNNIFSIISCIPGKNIEDCSSSLDGIMARDSITGKVAISFEGTDVNILDSSFDNEDGSVEYIFETLTK